MRKSPTYHRWLVVGATCGRLPLARRPLAARSRLHDGIACHPVPGTVKVVQQVLGRASATVTLDRYDHSYGDYSAISSTGCTPPPRPFAEFADQQWGDLAARTART